MLSEQLWSQKAKRKKNGLSQWLNVAFKKKAGTARETKTGLFARKKEKLGRWNIGLNLILQFEEKCSKKCQVEKGKNACYLSVFSFRWLRAGTTMVGCSFHWHFENV